MTWTHKLIAYSLPVRRSSLMDRFCLSWHISLEVFLVYISAHFKTRSCFVYLAHFIQKCCVVYFWHILHKIVFCIFWHISLERVLTYTSADCSTRSCFVYHDTFQRKIVLRLYDTFNLKVCSMYFDRFSTRLCFVCYLDTVHWKFSLCISRQISIQDRVLCIWHV